MQSHKSLDFISWILLSVWYSVLRIWILCFFFFSKGLFLFLHRQNFTLSRSSLVDCTQLLLTHKKVKHTSHSWKSLMKRGKQHAAQWRTCSTKLLGPLFSPTLVKNHPLLITSISMQMCTPVSQKISCSIRLKHGFMYPLMSKSCHIMLRYVNVFQWLKALWNFFYFGYNYVVTGKMGANFLGTKFSWEIAESVFELFHIEPTSFTFCQTIPFFGLGGWEWVVVQDIPDPCSMLLWHSRSILCSSFPFSLIPHLHELLFVALLFIGYK